MNDECSHTDIHPEMYLQHEKKRKTPDVSTNSSVCIPRMNQLAILKRRDFVKCPRINSTKRE